MGNSVSYKEWFDETESKYLVEIFRELARRQQPYDLIDKNSFVSYFGLPGLFGERLFDAFGSELNLDHFVRTIGRVSKTSKKNRIAFLFRILDLDNDGELCATELETMLRHLKKNEADVRKAVDLYFHKSKTLNLEDFTRLVYQGHDFGLYQFIFSRIPFSPSSPSSSKRSTIRSIRDRRRISVSSIQTHESFNDETTKSNTFEGKLYKKTRNLKFFFTQRYYYLHGNLLCYYASDRKIRPKGVVYLDSCRIESIENPSLESNNYYGFKIIPPSMNVSERELYARSETLRDQWIRSLRVASRNVDFDEKYEILEAIGRGRFSQVHLCHLRGTKEDRAVKITDKKIMNEKESELLRTEISVLRLVKHPNLIRLYDVFETPDAIFLVMELVTGGELYEHIVGRARFTEFECYNVVKPLLTGVAYLHELGIVHRDLKPENILCGDEIGDLKIADFGLSKFVMPSEMLKMPCGTLTYIAPEIVSNKGYDKKADIYSVGVIAFLLLRGRLPFEGKSPQEIIEKIQNKKLDFQDRVWSKLSIEVRDFVARLLSRTPSKRPNACDALIDPWMKLMETKVRLSNRSLKNVQCPTSPIRVSKYPKSTSKPKHSHFLSLPPSSPIKTSLKKKKTRRKSFGRKSLSFS